MYLVASTAWRAGDRVIGVQNLVGRARIRRSR
jgi:hypothetical protein